MHQFFANIRTDDLVVFFIASVAVFFAYYLGMYMERKFPSRRR